MSNYIHGIVDIYSGDGEWDLTMALRDGLKVFIHKATEGTDFTDTGFNYAMTCANMVGVLRGAYHFGRSSSSGKYQADRFMDMVRPRGDDIRLILDLEGDLSAASTMTTDQACDFILRVEERDGRAPILYGGTSKTRERMVKATPDEREVFGRCDLWLAAYGPTPDGIHAPAPWTDWFMHQYTDGKVGPHDTAKYPRKFNGFHGGDLNVAKCADDAELKRRWLGK